jgi:regulator of protease activity HflC (stomatin/prohibitin superfamily)
MRAAGSQPRRPDHEVKGPIANSWYAWVLLAFVLGYWLFAWFLERIDLSAQVNAWWAANLSLLPQPPGVVFLWELVQPRVWRHFLPMIVGWWLAQDASIVLVRLLYELPTRSDARSFLQRLLSSASYAATTIGRALVIRGATLETERAKHVLLRVGGPGLIYIHGGEVAVTEMNGRFWRIIPPGKRRLERFEYIHTLVDLRQQERVAQDVRLLTKDAIELFTQVTAVYHIKRGRDPATRTNPYPFDAEAVRTAAYTLTVQGNGSVSTWKDFPLIFARGALRQIVANYNLDEIVHPERRVEEPYTTLQNELFRKMKASLENIGVELESVHIGSMKLPSPVAGQYIKYWQSHSEARITLSKADGEATAVEEREIARAEAEITMIQAILEGMQRARQAGATAHMSEIVALRLVEALERIAEQSQYAYPLPEELLFQLRNWRRELGPSGRRAPEESMRA